MRKEETVMKMVMDMEKIEWRWRRWNGDEDGEDVIDMMMMEKE